MGFVMYLNTIFKYYLCVCYVCLVARYDIKLKQYWNAFSKKAIKWAVLLGAKKVCVIL